MPNQSHARTNMLHTAQGVLVALGFLGTFGCARENSRGATAIDSERDSLAAYAQRNGASTPGGDDVWEANLRKTFTVDVQRMLVSGGQVALAVQLNDVWQKDSTYYAGFTNALLAWNLPYVTYELQVPNELVGRLLQDRGEDLIDEHYIIAVISSVYRPRLGFVSEVVPDEVSYVDSDPDYPDTYVAHGRLIAFRLSRPLDRVSRSR